MLMVAIALGKHHAPRGGSIPELRNAVFILGSRRGFPNYHSVNSDSAKRKAGTFVPASSLLGSLKGSASLFLLRRFLRLLLGGLLFRLRFFCFFLWLRFFLRCWLGRRFWRGRLFLGLLADDHQLLFLRLDDLFRFARKFLVVQP